MGENELSGILMPEKIDFQSKTATRDKEGHYTQGSISSRKHNTYKHMCTKQSLKINTANINIIEGEVYSWRLQYTTFNNEHDT